MTRLSEMKILMTISSINRDSGGPSRSVTELSSALAARSIPISLFSIDTGETLVIDTTVEVPYRLYLQKTGTSYFSRNSAIQHMSDELKREIGETKDAIIHNHGIWMRVNHLASQIARNREVPLVISTRGMLEPWALQFKKYKKRLAWQLYQKRDLESSTVIHATALQEAENLRDLGFKMPIAVIPNGVDVPSWREATKKQERIRTVLFMSRIHPVKGLLNLVEAWMLIKPKRWRVVIAGPDENGHQKVVEDAIKRAQLQNQFEFVGAVHGEKKWDLYSSADIFALPSFSENFGIVVAEALACGVPVITTKGTPWEELETHNCGWWVDVGVQPLAEALKKVTSLSDQERSEMGMRGRLLVKDSYSWSKIAADMTSVYEWVLGGGAPPSCVITD